ncbi:RNA-directed DNA polymerase from mobile element jockey [Pitangus sulphuratus]|nr:RNA-directed DNA polymerase from mobile element jockey [Pitangus sulphuratus]
MTGGVMWFQLTLNLYRIYCSKLNAHKMMGPDESYPRLWRELADVIVSPLTAVLVLGTWRVPVNWKLANVIPIFKKGKNENNGNYRPVSLTPETGEVMEKIIPGIFEKHLIDNAVIGQSQHLLTKGQSCMAPPGTWAGG